MPVAELRLSEVIAALSRALDLADGHALGHAARTCLIGMRLAHELGLETSDQSALFYALLLKDAGCSANAAKVSSLYGTDDLEAKRNVRLIDHKRLGEAARYVWANVGRGTPAARLRNAIRVGIAGPKVAREMTEIRCERGADIAAMLGLPRETAAGIRALDEHFDGKGHPHGLAGEQIPLVGRILALAQAVEVFATAHGRDRAYVMAAERSGRWFDPQLVAALERFRDEEGLWAALASPTVERDAAQLEPLELVLPADEDRLDRVAEAFALVIDAKSPYTFRHSERVAELAVAAGVELGLEPLDLLDLRRAGLMHDVGKLGVSNLILDKPGRLTDEERAAMQLHTRYTYEILSRVGAFASIAEDAAAHHEKLDGSGYHRGLRGAALSMHARLLAVADVFEALTTARPYREPLAVAEALDVVRREVGTGLCPSAFGALERSIERRVQRLAA
jgi:HD-GYP domain-containing protein (c-di-GMP phosphodiesterase class II)